MKRKRWWGDRARGAEAVPLPRSTSFDRWRRSMSRSRIDVEFRLRVSSFDCEFRASTARFELRLRDSSFDCEIRVSTARFEFRLRVSSFDCEFRGSTARFEVRQKWRFDLRDASTPTTPTTPTTDGDDDALLPFQRLD